MMFGIGVLALIFLAGYWLGYKSKSAGKSKIDNSLSQRNTEWYNFIRSYQKVSKNKDQKSLILRILKDIRAQGLVSGVIDETDSFKYEETENTTEQPLANYSEPNPAYSAVAETETLLSETTQDPNKTKLDNISLLLYFGAFLFIASVGLFVAFGDFNGILKTLIILTMALGLYVLGCWLYNTKQTLKIVGVAFAAIGMAIVPLVGFAANSYIFDNSNVALTWLITSIIAAGVYGHAVWLFKNSFMNYIFIFTSLSLFESMVSVVSAPIYVFGWAMAFMSILLTLVSLYKNIWPEFRQSAVASGAVLLPTSLFISIIMVGRVGYWQLGVSLLLVAAYSLMQFVAIAGSDKEAYLSATQVAILSAVGVFTYSATQNLPDVGIVLLVASVAQASMFLYKKWPSSRMLYYSYVVLFFAILSVFLGIGHPLQVLISAVVVSVIAYVLWISQQRDDAYIIASVGVMAAPAIFGQYFSEPRLSYDTQTVLLFIPLVVQYLFVMFLFYKNKFTQPYFNACALLLIDVGLIAFVGLFGNSQIYMLTVLTMLLISASLYLRSKDQLWLYVASGLTIMPIFQSFNNGKDLLYTIAIGLVANISIVLMARFEFSRWVGTLIWLILPIGLIKSGLVGTALASYAGLYFIAVIGLLFARAIARGVILFSPKKTLASYSSTASVSYMLGMLIASTVSLVFVVLSGDNVLTMLIISGIAAVLVICGAFVEKHSLYFAPVAFFAQWLIWLAVQPAPGSNASIQIYTLLSTVTAIAIYAMASTLKFIDYKGSRSTSEVLQLTGLSAGFVAPFSVLYLGNYWPLPLAFMALIGCFYHMFRQDLQSTKELIIGIGVAGLIWLMCALGVREPQAYSHVIVAMFAGFAVWRHYRGEKQASDNYIVATVLTATIPLLLQALSGAAGGLYGWWLLIEQVIIMIIGFAISSKFMVRWGLYVAVGSVLYQLRGLGWAALSLLAVFVIGVAIYEMQKLNKN